MAKAGDHHGKAAFGDGGDEFGVGQCASRFYHRIFTAVRPRPGVRSVDRSELIFMALERTRLTVTGQSEQQRKIAFKNRVEKYFRRAGIDPDKPALQGAVEALPSLATIQNWANTVDKKLWCERVCRHSPWRATEHVARMQRSEMRERSLWRMTLGFATLRPGYGLLQGKPVCIG